MAIADTAPQPPTTATRIARIFSWTVVLATFAYVINCYLSFAWDWPGLPALFEGAAGPLAWIQLAIYLAAFVLAAGHVMRSPDRALREDSLTIAAIARWIVRAAFWIVLLVGLADAVISFLRVENLLSGVVGADLAESLGRPKFRGHYVHIPLIALSVVIASLTRGLAFTWLALLVVVAELIIVITRFIFSYEQAFMGDLVRFWYAALFLFASAYTLYEDGHVRVDVVYAGLSQKTRGLINVIGSIILGMALCTVILSLGLWSKFSVIASPLLNFEVSQSGYGMYVKYLMAGFLGVFAITMIIQFASYVLESLADYRGDPGHREPAGESMH